jgi:hypothetical protein
MTAPPLPASPCVRVRLDYTQTDGFKGGNRFFLAYSASAPTAANCATLASDIAAAWATDIGGAISSDWALTEVDVLDIASDSGLSGQWTGSDAGTNTGTPLPAPTAINVEFDIARRYRGGKPRIFWPPATESELANMSTWDSTFVGTFNTGVTSFFAAIAALSIGAMGALSHVNLSYYQGFVNVTNSSGRTRAAPKYRPVATVDPISGYATKAEIGSQKRRRAALAY